MWFGSVTSNRTSFRSVHQKGNLIGQVQVAWERKGVNSPVALEAVAAAAAAMTTTTTDRSLNQPINLSSASRPRAMTMTTCEG